MYRGAARPLVRAPPLCPEIHGETGLCGAELSTPDKGAEAERAVVAMAETIRTAFQARGGAERVQLVATGAMTNVALLLSMYPEVAAMVDVSIMGGAHTGGNTSGQ